MGYVLIGFAGFIIGILVGLKVKGKINVGYKQNINIK